MSLLEITRPEQADPLDTIERIASLNEWSYERAGEDEITIVTKGEWTDYQVSFTWMREIEALHLACAFDLRVPQARRSEVQRLIARINEQLWIGHFDIWTQNGLIMFRYALMLAGGSTASSEQCSALLGAGLDACERYFPAFQFVIWAGRSAAEAMDAAMFETMGEA
jgi:hypothetical protein